jgi:hypothetical protein
MARPRKENPKTEKLTIRLTPDELAVIEEKALAASCDRSQYARDCLLNNQLTAPKPLPEIRAKTYSQLGRIGGLLNQYMKAINSGIPENIPVQLIEDLYSQLKQIREDLWRPQD